MKRTKKIKRSRTTTLSVRRRALKLPPLDVPAFVGATRVAVLRVSLFPPQDDPVLDHFQLFGAVASVRWTEIEHDEWRTRAWIDMQHHRLGWKPDQLVRLGYFLFVDGDVCAYHAGEIDFKQDAWLLGLGVAATVAGLVSENAKWSERGAYAARLGVLRRVCGLFHEQIARALAGTASSTSGPAALPQPPLDKVSAAFRIISMPPTATHAEVKTAVRTLARTYHPDFEPNDAAKSEANRRMSEINVAYSEICAARGW